MQLPALLHAVCNKGQLAALSCCLWNTYLIKGSSMQEFLVYMTPAFLLDWQSLLLDADF